MNLYEKYRPLRRSMATYAMGTKQGRAYIFNEAHGMSKGAVRLMLGVLEPIPSHVVFIFTTTIDGMALFEDGQIDAGPLLSRCVRLLRGIIRHERLEDGHDIGYYTNKVNAANGNFRALLQAI